MSSPFVKIVDDKLTIQTAVDIPDSESIRVVSILGKARMGKSTFLNAIVSKLGGINKKPFATQDNDEHCTRGIDSYYCAEQKLLLLDCQGLALEDSSHDPALLLFAYLISDIIIFNERMMLQNEALKLMEPICAFMTYLSMDDVVKPHLFFRISDGDIVKDKQKNLDKVIRTRYNDQYQTIRDSITNLFHDAIGIVKTDSLDRTMKAKLADDDYLALFTDSSLGFESSVEEILNALPTGRSALIWKQLVPKFIQNINNNEKITIDKLDVVGNAGKLEIREWLDELDDKLFTDLPADGLQATYDAHIKPRQNEKRRILTEFTRKFKAVSETIKKPHYDKLASRLHEPIQKALDFMTTLAQALVHKEWFAATSNKSVTITNKDQSFQSYDFVFWERVLPAHHELRMACEPIYAPVKEGYINWLDQCHEDLTKQVKKLVAKEVAELDLLQSLSDITVESFMTNQLNLIQEMKHSNEFNLLLVNPQTYADLKISEQITHSEPQFCKIPKLRSLTLTIHDKKFQATPLEVNEQTGSLFTNQVSLKHDLVAPIYNNFVKVIRGDVIRPQLVMAVTEHKKALLSGFSVSQYYTTRIPDVDFVCANVYFLSGNSDTRHITLGTFETHCKPLIESVLTKMDKEGYLVDGDKEQLCRLVTSSTTSNIVQTYTFGRHEEMSLRSIFWEFYTKMVAKERVKGPGSLFIPNLMDPATEEVSPIVSRPTIKQTTHRDKLFGRHKGALRELLSSSSFVAQQNNSLLLQSPNLNKN
jgi:hypothetical protein